MKISAIIAGIVGLGLALWLLQNFGVERILGLLNTAGVVGIGVIIAFHFVQLVFSAGAWWIIVEPTALRPRFATFAALRWIREAVNNLLPVAQIGGEFVAARLLKRLNFPLAFGIAGTIADLTMEMVTQLLFTLMGLGLLLYGGDAGTVETYVGGFLLVGILVAGAFLGAQWFGVAIALEKGLLRLGRALGWAGTAQVEGLQKALLDCYRRPRRVLLAMASHSFSWLLGGIEVCLALHFLGHDVSGRAGLVIESLGQALKAAGFAVPGALGVQEGGYIVICQLFGLAPEVAIALSLVKRLREVVLGVPGLIAWQYFDKRAQPASSGSLGAIR